MCRSVCLGEIQGQREVMDVWRGTSYREGERDDKRLKEQEGEATFLRDG